MIVVQWEPPIDFTRFDTIARFDCGETQDINPNFSKVQDLVSISAYDARGHIVNTDVYLTTFNPSGLCEITGTHSVPWGFKQRFIRYDVYNDDLMQHQEFYTNGSGDFFFYAVPGSRVKLKFQDDRNFYWFAVPDKVTIDFTSLLNSYGYAVREQSFIVANPYNNVTFS